ncbi:MAG TPA: enoyl-CoA hydratase/isomerase family protein [Bryobacteraceae bacterium]|nr:enoyl-CoA hydratase/isomerase family protein [Bryobacteraceae bacterium]HUO29337.1 enoyl-CoA hydratase/isomerase family protein [Bryobacteraceae bacterium]
MASDQAVLYQVQDGVARITLNRPEKRNALIPALISGLRDALADSSRDASVRVVVLRGAGKDFCSGMDLRAFHEGLGGDALQYREEARRMAVLFLEMRHHPRPIVAAVHGRALGGGCGIATAADLLVASHSAQFGYPEVNVGFVPAMVMAILRRAVTEKRAFEMIVSGESLTAQTACDHGMVNRVFADQTFDLDVDAYVARLAAKSATAITLAKQLFYRTDAVGFEAAVEAGADTNAIARTTPDFERGIAEFLKKR